MPVKIGSDILGKKRLRFRRELDRANQIEIQIKVLEKLSEKPMTSKELRQFIENLGGCHYLLLPILKNSGLVEVKRAEAGKQGSGFVYSLKKL